MKSRQDRMIIIILGVPRSGTTLLRLLLGGHSHICGACETPWITGGYGTNSVRDLVEYLTTSPSNPVDNLDGVTEELIVSLGRKMVHEILYSYASSSGKPHILIKTPDDVSRLPFLTQVFPDALYVHIYRDGRDVACSTVNARESHIGTSLGEFGENNLINALRRWCVWEEGTRTEIASGSIRTSMDVRYEELVQQPERVLHSICDYLDLPFEAEMLDICIEKQNLPAWEEGHRDRLRKPVIDHGSVGRWKDQIRQSDMRQIDENFGVSLQKMGYPLCSDEIDLSQTPESLPEHQSSDFWRDTALLTKNFLRMAPMMPVHACRAMASSIKADLERLLESRRV